MRPCRRSAPSRRRRHGDRAVIGSAPGYPFPFGALGEFGGVLLPRQARASVEHKYRNLQLKLAAHARAAQRWRAEPSAHARETLDFLRLAGGPLPLVMQPLPHEAPRASPEALRDSLRAQRERVEAQQVCQDAQIS
jgi:hypothetical protein